MWKFKAKKSSFEESIKTVYLENLTIVYNLTLNVTEYLGTRLLSDGILLLNMLSLYIFCNFLYSPEMKIIENVFENSTSVK